MYMICSLMIEVQTCGMSIYEFFFFKQKTAYEMRISDWSSDVCSTDLHPRSGTVTPFPRARRFPDRHATSPGAPDNSAMPAEGSHPRGTASRRSEEHTSELQSLMRISYAVFCLKKKITKISSIDRREPHQQQH